MLKRFTILTQLVVAIAVFAAAAPPQKRAHVPPRTPAGARKPAPPSLPCGDLLSFQILMDRQGFSSGQIDGHTGPNFSHALAALQTARELTASGEPDCDTWHVLGGDGADQLLSEYTISEDDANYPYQKNIPHDLVEQSTLDDLGYQSIAERLGERFHAAPALLQRLNQGKTFAAGTTITVPGVTPFDASAKPVPAASAGPVSLMVSRDDSALRALASSGSIVFFAPVTTGSEFDPLPPGAWTVKGTQWYPPFHYNPKLFWDAKPEHTKATIKPGPNNPVGVVWIALNLEHYGLHGTPEPGSVGHTASHGCVRMTNWDAARVASLVKPGTAVEFR